MLESKIRNDVMLELNNCGFRFITGRDNNPIPLGEGGKGSAFIVYYSGLMLKRGLYVAKLFEKEEDADVEDEIITNIVCCINIIIDVY